jgi:hypothetical protein
VDSAVDRKPMQLFKQGPGRSAGVGLKDNASEGILNSLEFHDDRVWCTIKNRVCIIKTGTNKSMGYGGSSLCVEAGPNVPKSPNVEEAGLGNQADMFVEGERIVKCDAKEFYMISQLND